MNYSNIIKKETIDKPSMSNPKYSNLTTLTTEYRKIEIFKFMANDTINNDKILTIYEMEQYKESEYIIIDEAQFFKDLVDFVNYSTDILNKLLIVVGLNGDSDRKNLGEIKDIYPLADKITLLTALCLSCKDGTEAIFSKKITNKKEQIDVGNEDTYIPVCRKCYNNNLSTL